MLSTAPLLALGCSCDTPGVPGSDASADASEDLFDGAVDYPGEGEECRLSVECEPRQICVDDRCRRHERFYPGDLIFGGTGRSIGAAELVAIAGASADFPEVDPADPRWTVSVTTVAGASSPRLIGFPRHVGAIKSTSVAPDDAECRMVVVSDTVSYAAFGDTCHAAGHGVGDEIIIGGGLLDGTNGLYVRALGADLQEVTTHRIPVEMVSSIAAALGRDATLHQISSVLGTEATIFVGVRIGRPGRDGSPSELPGAPWGDDHFVIAGVDRTSGAVRLLPVGGTSVPSGDRPWLVEHDGLVGVVSTLGSSSTGEARLRYVSLDGVHEWPLGLDEPSHLGRVAQPTRSEWHLSIGHHPVCTHRIERHPAGEIWQAPLAGCDRDPSDPDVLFSITSWLFGGPAPAAPSVIAAAAEWLEPDPRGGVPLLTTDGTVAVFREPFPSSTPRAAAVIDRYGLTREVLMAPAERTESPFVWSEIPLRSE